jgi:glutamyl-tRNA reductase
VVLANRTPARAHELAATAGPDTGVDVEVVPFAKLSSAIVGANAVFTALEADAGHLGALELHGALESHHFPLVVDLGVPRNIDRAAADAAGLTVLDLDDLRSSVAHVMDDRRVEATRAEAIVDEEVDRYRSASRARGAAPVVAALRTRLESQRTSELERRRREFASLSDEDWGKVDALTKSVLAKLLHEPTMLLKETAGSPRGERLVEALRILFDL